MQMVGTYRAEIGQAYKPVSLANVRDDIRRGDTHSCTEGHSRDSTAVRWKYAFRSGPDLSRASRTLTAQSVKGD